MAWPEALNSLSLPSAIFASRTVSILLPISIGSSIGYITGRLATTKRIYATLHHPPGSPPAWLFSPVWTALYGVMGYASYRASARTTSGPSALTALYTIQLGLNFAWMPLFFGFKKPVAAMVDIIALMGCTGVLATWYAQVEPVAGVLMAPYLVWLGFAVYLTAGIGVLNRWDIKRAIARNKNKEERE